MFIKRKVYEELIDVNERLNRELVEVKLRGNEHVERQKEKINDLIVENVALKRKLENNLPGSTRVYYLNTPSTVITACAGVDNLSVVLQKASSIESFIVPRKDDKKTDFVIEISPISDEDLKSILNELEGTCVLTSSSGVKC